MFEKEAEDNKPPYAYCGLNIKCELWKDGFQKGAEFGYNKANEWHYVKDGDLPEIDNRIVLCVCSNGYINGKRNHILKLLTRKEFPLFQPVYAWKEIILPELKENE